MSESWLETFRLIEKIRQQTFEIAAQAEKEHVKMMIRQSAGDAQITTYTDGSPLWFEIKFGEVKISNLSADELVDLQYCIKRVLEKVEAQK